MLHETLRRAGLNDNKGHAMQNISLPAPLSLAPAGTTGCRGTLAAAPRPPGHGAARCCMSELMRWVGLPHLADLETDRLLVPLRRVMAEHALVVEGQAFETLFFVAGGSFKCVRTDMEGYEQVLGFALRGDCIGLDGMHNGHHASGAVALEDSTVAMMPFRELLDAGQRQPALLHLLHHAAGAELEHRSDTQYLMSPASAEVRVARFLLHYAGRQGAMGHSDRRIRLRMTRRDIASHLGVAHETVSRALTTLAQSGHIAVSYRDIEIVDALGLQDLQRVTRGSSRPAGRPRGEVAGEAAACA